MVARDKAGKRLAPADLYAESLLLKARAEMGLGRDDNALLAIESAKKEITGLTGDADTVARAAFDPRELPVGIVTALLGAPVFAVLMLTGRVRT